MVGYEVKSTTIKSYPRFSAEGRCTTLILREPPQGYNPVEWLEKTISDLLTYVTDPAEPHDFVGLTIKNTVHDMDKPIWLPMQRKKDINVETLWSLILKILQSNIRFSVNDELEVCVDIVHMPLGKGGIKRKGRDSSTLGYIKKSIVSIFGEQNCLAKAIVIGKAFADGDKKEYEKLKNAARQDKIYIRLVAEKMITAAGVDLSQGGGVPEIKKFQEHLAGYKIVVYNGLYEDRILFQGNGAKRINLLYDSGHYDVIVNLAAAMGFRKFCEACNKFYNSNPKNHLCKSKCFLCKSIPVCEPENEVSCRKCFRTFKSENCFNFHLKNKIGKSIVCDFLKFCLACGVCYAEKHDCNKKYCTTCKALHPVGGLCYIQCLKNKIPDNKHVLFVFYDIESRVEQEIEKGVFKHEANLLHLQQFCFVCENNDDLSTCPFCKTRTYTFEKDPVNEFIDYLCRPRVFSKIICLAHNAKGYDNQFVLEELLAREFKVDVIMKGTEILKMCFDHVTFLDSLNFLPMPLADFSKTFGLSSKKGFYPHKFNTLANRHYLGPYPPPNFFDVGSMKAEKRKDFFEWYETVKNKVFNNGEQLRTYCADDVTVLRQGCRVFRQLFLKVGSVDVFQEAITIASACNKILRRRFLEPSTIGLIPPQGYRLGDRQSPEAIEWLRSKEFELGFPIQHAGNGLEVSLPEFGRKKVDGYNEEKRHIFEYFGCFWHGCPHCFPYNRDKDVSKIKGDTLNIRYEQSLKRLQIFEERGYNVTYVWGCMFKKADHPPKEAPLRARDALYGGRTEAIKLYYHAKEGEVIRYTDIVSLYPYCCKYGKFPVGHPKVYIGAQCPPFEELSEGLLKCSVLPPTDLYHPVLPYKTHNKLMFSLCRTCTEELNQQNCDHDETERILTGTWVLDEVRLAVSKGYRVMEIFEFWEYKTTKYDPITDEGGLFVAYVNTFLKFKQEASGWPSWVKTEALKEKFIEDYFIAEKIKLDKDKIVKNPGLRYIAKLALNSMWGKFAQLENKQQTEIIKNADELMDFLTRPDIIVNKCLFTNNNWCWIGWEYKETGVMPSKIVNVVVASYVTAQARIKLYSYLEKLGERALYCDTDSIKFIQSSEHSYTVPTGENLGDMTDEVKKDYGESAYIIESVCAGPKSYSDRIVCPGKPDVFICKVKGITLDWNTSAVLNFNIIKELVLSKSHESINCERKKIKRRQPGEVVTVNSSKNFQVVFNKRRRIKENSFPYGFKLV